MDLNPTSKSLNRISKPDQELVEREKSEYKLLGRYVRTRGLTLYCYNPTNGKIYEVDYLKNDTLRMVFRDGRLDAIDVEFEKAMVDSRMIHFECLNYSNAVRRVKKWKQGKIKELDNLREFNPDGIQFFNQ